MQARNRIAAAIVLSAAALTVSGCGWVRSKKNDAYKMSAESRPLEVPPDLDRPAADAAMNIPSGGTSVTASQVQGGAPNTATPVATARDSASGFVVAGTRDAVFGQLATALAGVSGVTVNNKSELLGTYDVAFNGRQFLLRTAAVEGGVHVAAIDPRGSLDTSAEATRVIAALKAAMVR